MMLMTLSELVDLLKGVWNVGQRQTLEQFAAPVVVVALHDGRRLLKANVIEAGKTGPVDVLYGVVRYQKVLFPSHKHIIAFG